MKLDNAQAVEWLLLQVGFCPGGGVMSASPAAVKSLDFNSNHAKSPLAGVQWSLEAPKDLTCQT